VAPGRNDRAGGVNELGGSCLCGAVRFQVARPFPALYQCHCSLCRKQGGSVSNTGLIIAAEKFRWTRGEDAIGRWQRPTGFRSHFCTTCGSTVPNPLRDTGYVWVPAGLLDDDDDRLRVDAQLWLSSAMSCDRPRSDGMQHDEAPALGELIRFLHGHDRACA
jgi:hypothetical protein